MYIVRSLHEIVYEPTVAHEGSGESKMARTETWYRKSGPGSNTTFGNGKESCHGKCQAYEHKEIVPQVKRST